jgi:hypothetical protein
MGRSLGMQRADQDPVSEVEPFGEIGCMRCGITYFRGGTCEICLEALRELRALDEEFALRLRRQALPWHPSWAEWLSS